MPTISDHLCEPNVTLDAYVRRITIGLGVGLASMQAVYLDTNFWIALRRADIGVGSSGAVELLELLRKGVASGQIFCPISESIFIELMKQRDAKSRLATAALVDDLSLGVTFANQRSRIETEVAHFLYSKCSDAELHPLKHLVWCKLSYVLGIIHPTNTAFDSATELAVQKAFFDHMWTTSLLKIVKMIGNVEMPGTDLSDLAASLNVGISNHSAEVQSFDQAYSAEVRGTVDLFGETAVDVLKSMAARARFGPAHATVDEQLKLETTSKNILAAALVKNKGRDELRTLHILACLHASLRWNKRQKFEGNDLFDFDHAAAALAYCDAFFTERPLWTMVTKNNIALDRLYGCHVAADVDDAIAWVSKALEKSLV